MTPNRPKRHTQAEIDTAEGRDLNHHVTRYLDPPLGTPTYLVDCKRRNSPGHLQVEVKAATAELAMQYVKEGTAPGIGLGWIPLRALLKPGTGVG